MIKSYVVYRQDKNNVGDLASNPLQYFMKPGEYEEVDIGNIGRHQFDSNTPIVAGGGGLLANALFNDALRDLTISPDINNILNIGNELWKNTSAANINLRNEFFDKINPLIAEYANKLSNDKGPRIVWGAGHNGNYEKKFKGSLEYPLWLRNFDAVGVRDYGQEHHWVPCASCMHPALREHHKIKHPVIWFEHKKQLIKSTEFGSDPIPRFINSGDNIEETIRLLGSAEVILTNSYHGAYWGTLLGRKVIVVEAWSSKFNAMKHKPFFLGKGDFWKDYLARVPVHKRALEECVDATEQYWNSIKEYF